MNMDRVIDRHRVGEWEFLPATGELRRGDEIRRIEPRAAKALDMLCRARGEVVSQDQLIASVWGGRALSENSVAVVIGQLRRALDDHAREARLIETMPKRGYRLKSTPEAPRRPNRRPLVLLATAGVALAALLAAILLLPVGTGGQPLILGVSDVSNATGNPAYAPLARATSELIVTKAGQKGFAVRRGGPGDLRLASKLVMWDGLPYLGMSATDQAGVVRWSAMSKAVPGAVPPAVDAKLAELAAMFPPEQGRTRLANGEAAR